MTTSPAPTPFGEERRKLLRGLGIGSAAARRQRLVKPAHHLAAGVDHIDIGRVDDLGKLLMQLRPQSPKLEHVAEHGHPALELVARGEPERGKRRAHGGGVGIVAFIDDGDARRPCRR